MQFAVKPLTPFIGAELEGLDVTRLDDAGFEALFAAFTEHAVVFLRNQPALTAQQHVALARRFGDIHVHPATRARLSAAASADATDVHPGVISMRTTHESRVAAGNRWHSDVSCDAQPPQASILQLHEVPAVGGDTLFASLYAAYDALSERMQVMLDGLTALHSGEASFRHLFRFAGDGSGWPEHSHPIVRRHPDSGRPVLYVDREFTHCIDDLPKEEGRALLEFLFEHTERVDFQCRFRWTPNAIAIWDNRCVLHHAMWDYWPAERRGRRVSVVGERPLPWRLGVDAAPQRTRSVRLTV